MLRRHMKRVDQRLQCAACATLKCSLSTSCGLLLKQLIRIAVSFERHPPALFDDFITR